MKNVFQDLVAAIEAAQKTSADVKWFELKAKTDSWSDKFHLSVSKTWSLAGRGDTFNVAEMLINSHGDYESNELFGTVIFNDGTWLERAGEKFMSWEYKMAPKAPWEEDDYE